MHSVQVVVDEQRSLGLLSNDSSIASRQSLLSLSLLGMENTLKLLLLGNSVLVRIPSRVRQLPCYVSVSIPCTATLPHSVLDPRKHCFYPHLYSALHLQSRHLPSLSLLLSGVALSLRKFPPTILSYPRLAVLNILHGNRRPGRCSRMLPPSSSSDF
jgi:hypothetical protein